MKIKTDITSRITRYNSTFEIEKPNICPACNQSGDHLVVGKSINQEDELISLTLECTMCYELFFATYYVHVTKSQGNDYKNPVLTTLKVIYPYKKHESNLPEEMVSLFPDFVEIYLQTLEAESEGLHLITGIAYRKSIEFLVKQFLIEKIPSEEEKIKNEFLGQSIKRIEYPLIQRLATAATWLGNDEGHFTRKHENYDITDMKKFILALCHLIVAEKVAEEAADLVD